MWAFDGGDDKQNAPLQKTLDWLDKNQLAEPDEFWAKQDELEGAVNQIMAAAVARTLPARTSSNPWLGLD